MSFVMHYNNINNEGPHSHPPTIYSRRDTSNCYMKGTLGIFKFCFTLLTGTGTYFWGFTLKISKVLWVEVSKLFRMDR